MEMLVVTLAVLFAVAVFGVLFWALFFDHRDRFLVLSGVFSNLPALGAREKQELKERVLSLYMDREERRMVANSGR